MTPQATSAEVMGEEISGGATYQFNPSSFSTGTATEGTINLRTNARERPRIVQGKLFGLTIGQRLAPGARCGGPLMSPDESFAAAATSETGTACEQSECPGQSHDTFNRFRHFSQMEVVPHTSVTMVGISGGQFVACWPRR